MAKTKIIATVGPASDSSRTIKNLIKAGVSGFRFNLKHNDLNWHKERIRRVKEIASLIGRPVAIIMDIQGPEVRVGYLPGKRLELRKGEEVVFTNLYQEGKEKLILLDNLKLLQSLKKGQQLSIDDGRLAFEVINRQGKKVRAKVRRGGVLRERKGVNFPDLEINFPTLGERDYEALALGAQLNVDFVALSFVREKKDILRLKEVLKKIGLSAGVIAKIETKRAIRDFEAVLEASEGIMVARGDLAVELAYEKVPYFQKEIISNCRRVGKPVIVATEMLESMTRNPHPTRAEVSDVANAVYDAADSLMLSAESASGLYPLETVETMTRVAKFIELKRPSEIFQFEETDDITEAMVMAAFRLSHSSYAYDENIRAFVVLTDTGRTARLLSRYRPRLPILAVTNDRKVRNQLALSFGVEPFYLWFPKGNLHSVRRVMKFLRKERVLRKGEKVILIHGESWGTIGRTNTIRVQEVY